MQAIRMRQNFNLDHLCKNAEVIEHPYSLDGKPLGLIITPCATQLKQWPFNQSAYVFLQCLRQAIVHYGTIEIRDIAVNKTNHTLAQRDPNDHSYSSNAFLTDRYQSLHQDTPPYPTAFWLNKRRQNCATWVTKNQGLQAFHQRLIQGESIQAIHEALVHESLSNGTGLLLNIEPGLLLIDNSSAHQLYHARTSQHLIKSSPSSSPAALHNDEAALYAFNEQGLIHYIDTIDERRGNDHRDNQDKQAMLEFLKQEPSFY